MAEPTWPEKSENPELLRRQREIAIRALETISERIEALQSSSSPKEANIYAKQLFQLPSIKALLEERGIKATDEPEKIKEKLFALLQELREEKKRQIFYPEEHRAPEISATVPESSQEEMTNVLDEVNELYRLRDENYSYVEKERPKIEEALGQLAVFGSNINPKEAVEVARSQDGSVEVIFESDVDEIEALQAISNDIRASRERIAEYGRNIVEKDKKLQKGIFQRIFPSRQKEEAFSEPNPLQAFTKEELEGRKARTQQALLEVTQDYEVRSRELQQGIQMKKRALDVPLTVTGTDAFKGSWQELYDALKAGCEKFLEELDEGLSQFDERIETLEKRREAIEQQPT